MVIDQRVDVVVADLGLDRSRDAVGRCRAVGAPAATVGDPAELLDVHVHQLAGPVAFVAHRGDLGGPDHLTGHRVQRAPARGTRWRARIRDTVRAGTPSSAPIQSGPRRSLTAQLDDLLLDLGAGPRRARVRARGSVLQPGLALGGVAVDPGLHALARDPHRRRDVGLLPAAPDAAARSAAGRGRVGAGITVGHENLRVDVGLRQATPHPGVLLVQADPPLTNVLAGRFAERSRVYRADRSPFSYFLLSLLSFSQATVLYFNPTAHPVLSRSHVPLRPQCSAVQSLRPSVAPARAFSTHPCVVLGGLISPRCYLFIISPTAKYSHITIADCCLTCSPELDRQREPGQRADSAQTPQPHHQRVNSLSRPSPHRGVSRSRRLSHSAPRRIDSKVICSAEASNRCRRNHTSWALVQAVRRVDDPLAHSNFDSSAGRIKSPRQSSRARQIRRSLVHGSTNRRNS